MSCAFRNEHIVTQKYGKRLLILAYDWKLSDILSYQKVVEPEKDVKRRNGKTNRVFLLLCYKNLGMVPLQKRGVDTGIIQIISNSDTIADVV